MVVTVTDHFKKRFFERQAHTKRVVEFAVSAYREGKDADNVWLNYFSDTLARKGKEYGTIAKIYKGYIYWFDENATAITIYPIPQKIMQRIK